MTSALVHQRRSIGAAIALFFLAPLVAEFLLGNLPITMLPALILLAPMYGGGALLIRELVRRTQRGWPSIVLLAIAYGIVEEAFTTQTLFNPNYLNLHLHLLQSAYIGFLGIGGWWTIFVLTLHAAWSISTSIALIEATVPDRAGTPWLGPIGLSITALLFVLGAVGNTFIGYRQDHFIARPAQFAVSAALVVGFALAAFLLRANQPAQAPGSAPSPWLTGALALVAGSAVLLIPATWGWGAAIAVLAVDLGMVALILYWGRLASWTLLHKLSLAAGAALAYGWHAFIENPVIGKNLMAARIGNVVFAVAALALIAFAARRAARLKDAPRLVAQ